MKKSQLKNMIKETILKEYEEVEGYVEAEAFTNGTDPADGWDERALEDIGVMDLIKEVEKVAYELRNARRGSYADFGDTPEELAMELNRLGKNLLEASDTIMVQRDSR